MLAPETITHDSPVTLGVLWTLLAAIVVGGFTLIAWVRGVLRDYVKKDVFDEIQKARAEQLGRMEDKLDELKEDLREMRHGR